MAIAATEQVPTRHGHLPQRTTASQCERKTCVQFCMCLYVCYGCPKFSEAKEVCICFELCDDVEGKFKGDFVTILCAEL